MTRYLYDTDYDGGMSRAEIIARWPEYDDADEPPYFWCSCFRFDLREAPLAVRYEVRKRFDDAGLPRDGFTEAHLDIVDEVLGQCSWARRYVRDGQMELDEIGCEAVTSRAD